MKNNAIVTKYRVEWRDDQAMDRPLSMIVYNTSNPLIECTLSMLKTNRRYFVRVSAGNHKGFSRPLPTQPASAVPSSWRQVVGAKRRKLDDKLLRKFLKLVALNKRILTPGCDSSTGSKSPLANMLLLDQNQHQQQHHKHNPLAKNATLTTSGKLGHYEFDFEADFATGVRVGSKAQHLN